MQFAAILFDCDGVLVDSEPITITVLRDMLAEQGWNMSYDQCYDLFIGKATIDELALIRERTGKDLGMDWILQFRQRRNQALSGTVMPIPGIREALLIIQQRYPNGIACASGADRPKLNLQLGQTGLLEFFQGHIYSGAETARNKPYPDVYLAAAQGLGVPATQCAVIEDSTIGTRAGVAAGATVIAYCPAGQETQLRAAGAAYTFRRMDELAGLLEKIEQNRAQNNHAAD